MIVFNERSSPFIVFPYYEGGDLFELVAKHHALITPAIATRIFSDISKAVSYLHDNNITHRDIKLENVLLTITPEKLFALENVQSHPTPLVVLSDLGLSTKFSPDAPLLTTRCGSVDYIPPELLMGEPYDGRQIDSWALGVLLYAIMEGKLPFNPRCNRKTVSLIVKIEWFWCKHRNNLSSEWESAKRIVAGCLRKRDNRLLVKDMVAGMTVA